MKILIVGGSGSLGRALIKESKSRGYKIFSIDFKPNADAHVNFLLEPSSALELGKISNEVSSQAPYDAIFCVAGGWSGGSIHEPNFLQSVQAMWDCNALSSAIAASFLSLLKEGGLSIFMSAKASLKPCPEMIAYGMAKSAVNSLVRSCGSLLGEKAHIIGILPEVLDTEANRAGMPGQDTSNWTPLPALCDIILGWLTGNIQCPATGSLVTVMTRAGNTTTKLVEP